MPVPGVRFSVVVHRRPDRVGRRAVSPSPGWVIAGCARCRVLIRRDRSGPARDNVGVGRRLLIGAARARVTIAADANVAQGIDFALINEGSARN